MLRKQEGSARGDVNMEGSVQVCVFEAVSERKNQRDEEEQQEDEEKVIGRKILFLGRALFTQPESQV